MTEELEKRPLEDSKMELQMFQVIPVLEDSSYATEFGCAPVVHCGHSVPKESNSKRSDSWCYGYPWNPRLPS